MTAVECSIARKPSFGASLDTLPHNPKLKALPTVAFKGVALEPLDNASGSRKMAGTNRIYWKLFFKEIIKTAQEDHETAADLLKKAAHNFLVHPFYLAVTNVAIQNMNKPKKS
jgi:hypothetical protein